MPPGRYERRKGVIGNGQHDKFWRTHWIACITQLLNEHQIDPTTAAVALALADFSSTTGEHVWPSQATIGARCQRSPSTVNRSLAQLRALGMLEWDHRFRGPTNDNPHPSAESNMYEFRLPAELCARIGIRQPRRRNQRQQPAVASEQHIRHQQRRNAESAGAGLAQLRDITYDTALAELDDRYRNEPELHNIAVAALDEYWRRRT